MNGIIIRFTANKREVGILKTSPQSRGSSPIKSHPDKGGKCNCENEKTYLSLKFKCFEKYRNFENGDKLSRIKPDVSSKKDRVVQSEKYRTKQDVSDREPIRSDSVLKREDKSKEGKRFIKLKRGKSQENPHPKYPSIKSAVKRFINDLKRDSSDEESERKHPNRRLQRERPEGELPTKRARYGRPRSVVVAVVNRHDPAPEVQPNHEVEDVKPEIVAIKEEKVETETQKRVASMWEQVLDSPPTGEEETSYIEQKYDTRETETEDDDSEVDYAGLLQEFVLHKVEECGVRGRTPYEMRVDEMFKEPSLVEEFYIPPALVEALHYRMKQDRTAEESLRRVCATKNWPEPRYACASAGRDGFLYSCTLKTKTFVPARPASNVDLAKDLAALECLEWLGFRQRAALGRPSLQDTYFQ